jgi:hypothetical protein
MQLPLLYLQPFLLHCSRPESMSNRFVSVLCSAALVSATLLGVSTASAQDVGREYDRGCADAKGGSYDRSKHSSAYEDGWQACKAQAAKAKPAPSHGKEWNRGCSDAKGGSYDRSKHSKAYEEGWQSCKAQ